MRNIIKTVYTILTLALTVTLVSCASGGAGSQDDTADTTYFSLPAGITAFYNPGIDITPVISATESASLAKSQISLKGWDSLNPLNYAFDVLRQYNHPDDDGKVNLSNMYKLLFEMGNGFERVAGEIDADLAGTNLGAGGKIITSPFDFGTTTKVYTHAFTAVSTDAKDLGYTISGALAKNGEEYDVLMSFVWDESDDVDHPGKMTYGVLEGSFDDLETGNLILNLAYMVDYNDGEIYAARTLISGNAGTHNFNLITAIANKNPDDTRAVYGLASAGISYSDVAGSDDYFLLKFNGKGVDGKFFRIEALSPDEADLMDYLATGYDLQSISDPAYYAATLDGLTFFTVSDIPLQLSDFTGSSVVLDY